MKDPYQKYLESLCGREEIVIERSNASELRGSISLLDEDKEGCVIDISQKGGESKLSVFVAFRDMRGVSVVGWDLDNR